MKGHDWIIWFMCIMACFSLPQLYRMQELATFSNLKMKMNMYLDTAVESAAYNNFDVTEDGIEWRREAIIDTFEREVKNMLNLEIDSFPVFLVRQKNDAYFYENGEWLNIKLTDDAMKNSVILQQKMEQLLGCSNISNIYLPNEYESNFCNPISDYSIFTILKLKDLIYITSGSCVEEVIT